MKKEVTKTIPAVKARPAKKTTNVITYCDFCAKKSADHYGNERKCMCCRRDICQTHQNYDPNELSDYGGHYCPICIKLLTAKYQLLIDKMQSRHYKEEEELEKQMAKESLEMEKA